MINVTADLIEAQNVEFFYFQNAYVTHNRLTTRISHRGRIISGLIILSISLPGLYLHRVFLKATVNSCGFGLKFIHLILYLISITDVIQLLGHIFSAYLYFTLKPTTTEWFSVITYFTINATIFATRFFILTYVDRLFIQLILSLFPLGFYLVSFFMYHSLNVHLPIHRFGAICFRPLEKFMLSKAVQVAFLVLMVLLMIFYMLLYLTPIRGVTFAPESEYWSSCWNRSDPFSYKVYRLSQTAQRVVMLVPIVIGVPMYSTIVVQISKQRGTISRKEIMLTIQLFSMYIISFILWVWWYGITDYITDAVESMPLYNLLSDILHCVFNGLQPVTALAFNKSARESMMAVIAHDFGRTSSNGSSEGGAQQNQNQWVKKTPPTITTTSTTEF